MEYIVLGAIDRATILTKNEIAEFLIEQMDGYGDDYIEISKCLDFALSNYPHQGGFVVLAKENDSIKGAVVVCKTGMEAFIPENVLVYFAVHRDYRGRGLGTALLKKTIKLVNGGISLHVHPKNPARELFEKVGFQYRSFEMRLQED